ncbi:MAG: MarR family transcriptional regulator [Candidatus Gracilibacteria bacterium]
MGNPASPTPTPEHQADAERLADFVLFAQRSTILGLSKTLNEGNVSFPQFFFLAYLASVDYQTPTDIAKKMNFSSAAATGFIDRMEKLGLVERTHSHEDRRNIMVRITGKGAEFVATMREEIKGELETLLSGWEEEKSQTTGGTKRALRTLMPNS